MHFYGDILAGMTTTRHSFPDFPSREYSSTIEGRYLGPRDPK